MCRLLAALLAVALYVAAARANPLLLLAPVMPSPTDVVRLLDGWTQKDSAIAVDVKVGKAVSQGKLLVARAKLDVTLERSSRNWRGKITSKLTVPSEVTYSVDLARVKASDVTVDKARGVIVVKLPPIRVEDVTPVLSAIDAKDEYSWVRYRWLDKANQRELQHTMLTHDYREKAREAAAKETAKVAPSARKAAAAFLATLLAAGRPGVKVEVR